MNRQLIIDLETISTIANLEKHNHDDENLKEISYIIPQNLEKGKKDIRIHQSIISANNFTESSFYKRKV